MIQDHHRYIVSFGKLVIKLKEVEVEGTASFRRNYINIRVLVFAYMHFLLGIILWTMYIWIYISVSHIKFTRTKFSQITPLQEGKGGNI